MSAALAAALLACLGPPARAQPPRIQVAIVRQALSARLDVDGPARLLLPGRKPRPLRWRGAMMLRPASGGLTLAGEFLPSETRLEPGAGTTLRVGTDPHRGSLILRLDPGQTVTIVEELGLEKYVEGVLPQEMDPDWPLEALKAQAVVARTFAYANLGKFRKDGFDLTADTQSQVYRGRADVNARVRRAVRETTGEVLGWKGKLLRVFYHSCCGGWTENPARVWGMSDVPRPLRGVRDPWCRDSPAWRWTASFPRQVLTAAVDAVQALPGPLTGLRTDHRDTAGYILDFIARAGSYRIRVPAAALRRALGTGELKSTKILRLRFSARRVFFAGAGSGHGVGLCQWGARRQAEAGRNYERILRFYFPGAELAEIAD